MDINNIIFPAISLGGMGLLFGLGLGYAAKKFRVVEDEKLLSVREALPGANCGGCGYVGCDSFAAALLKGEANPNDCPVGGEKSVLRLGEILGIKVEVKEKQVSFIKCAGCSSKSVFRYDYAGVANCKAAMHLVGGGSKSCSYGCLGYGTCLQACCFDAISIVDGIAVVDPEKCTACGKCVKACPKKLIEMVPYRSKVKVACNSKDSGKAVRANCSVGCISCKMCVKACEAGAVTVDGGIATIDYSKCTNCGACAAKCPTKAITQV